MSSGSAGRRAGVTASLLLALPVLVGIGYAAAAATGIAGVGATGGFSVDRIRNVLGEAVVRESLWWSVRVAALSTGISTLVAAGLAVAFRGTRRTDRAGRLLSILPLPVPHLVAAVAALLILGQSGLLARITALAGWIGGPAEMPALTRDRAGIGMIVALVWKEVPFLTLVAGAVLATRGDALERTARALGAGPWTTLRRVTWPVLSRGMLPAVVAVFTFVVGSYEVAALLAPSDPIALPLLTWERYTDADLARRPDAFVLTLLGVAIAAVAVVLHEWLADRGTST